MGIKKKLDAQNIESKFIMGLRITDEKMIECARLLRKYGIGFATENILAIPPSTLEHDIETLALNLKCKPLYGGAKLMQPYPGTMIYNIAVRMKLFKEKNFDVLTDFTASSNLKIDNRLERENLQRLFAIVIRFPFLFRHIRFLIGLRLKPLYAVLHEIFKAYIGIKFMTYRRSLREYYVVFRRFIFSRESTIFFQTDGRNEDTINIVENYSKEQGLWSSNEMEFTDTLSLDMSKVVPTISGPKRPLDKVLLTAASSNSQKVFESVTKRKSPLISNIEGLEYEIMDGSILIAAITSCTNTSNPNVLIGAGLLAKKAVELGLKTKPWVKTSLAPGSQVVTDYLAKAGLNIFLDELGFNLVGYGCTTCIGNSGPLPE